jgi:hypothetical protein
VLGGFFSDCNRCIPGVKLVMMMMMIFLLRYALRRAGPATAIYKGNRTIKAG